MTAQLPHQRPAVLGPRSTPSTGPTCANCDKAEDIDKPLVACTQCSRSYHRSCHRPPPEDLFICARCHNRAQRAKILKSYDGIGPRSPSSKYLSAPQPASTSTSVTPSGQSAKAEMLPSNGKPNPFLTEDTSYWATTSSSKCRFPQCHNDADKNHLTCEVHSNIKPSVPPKTIKNSDRPPTLCHDSLPSLQSNGSHRPPDSRPSTSPSRKNLEAKTTARKTVARRPPSADARPAQNGHFPRMIGLQRPVDQTSFGEGPARKKQRLITPSSDEPTPRLAMSASPLARPSGFPHGKPNGGVAHQSRLPTLNRTALSKDVSSYSSEAPPPVTIKPKPVGPLATYDDYIHWSSPPTLPRLANSDVPRLSIATNAGPAIASGYNADLSSRATSRDASVDRSGNSLDRNGSRVLNGSLSTIKTLDHRSFEPVSVGRLEPNETASKPGPSRPTPPKPAIRLNFKANKAKASNTEKPKDPSPSTTGWISRTPPVEKRRRRLVEQHKESSLDAFIYGQSTSSAPPPGVVIERRPNLTRLPLEKGYFLQMNPQIQWTRPHSEEWYKQKEEEIKTRGGRKANMGKAAQRMADQLRMEDPEDFEARLPDRVRNNEDLLAAARFLRGGVRGASVSQQPPPPAAVATPVRVKRKYNRKQPLVPPQPTLSKNPLGPDAA